MPLKAMDHAAYQRKLKHLNREQLEYIVADARAAVAAMPNGENAGYYMDEVHYASMELRKRKG